ncbi:zinc finger BED domain-containing protein RICESLEEPER 2-like [Canna indica]|uniref:Zinc finger BED domain-containing protein RICESLEEPER 2-like n=1 Tax=Canna indica TaxID=4628 RepID=A0AAQ3KSQ3_9LILI|nr:zinc finger BED domain-containing protein RICESLEEPER 2-like [Canna indica]
MLKNAKEANNDNQVVNLVEDNANEDNPFEKRKRKKTSGVWNEFTIIKLSNGTEKVQCNHCHVKLQKSATGTTTQYKRHLDNCPRRKYSAKGQLNLSVQPSKSGSASVQTWKYDQAKMRKFISHMVLVHELPFAFVEYEIFNMVMKFSNPAYEKISCATVKGDYITSYQMEKKRLMALLKTTSRVSITTDCWRSGQNIQYMVVTCHFVDSDWKLQKRIINFINVIGSTGVMISDALFKCLQEWELEKKVFTITVDNASYNDSAVRMLKDNISVFKKLSLNGKFFHVRCCAHILNILVQDGLSEIQDAIFNIRESVKYISASPSRLSMFCDIAKQLQLPNKKLILDCCTRWNATYEMLSCSLEFQNVFPRFQVRDSSYKYLPSSEYPTANLFLPELWRIKNALNDKIDDDDECVRAMARKMKVKFDKYWGDCNLLISIAAILDPRNKMQLVTFCFDAIYSKEEASKYIKVVRDSLYEIYQEYVDAYAARVEKSNNTESGQDENSDNLSRFSKGKTNV